MKLASLFTSNMVLQQNKVIRIFGYGHGSVAVTFKGKVTKAVISESDLDEAGRWVVELPAYKAGGPYKMKISLNDQEFILKNIMIGEVLLVAGQSNMALPLMMTNCGFTEADSAFDKNIRFFDTPGLYNATKPIISKDGKKYDDLSQCDKPWEQCTPDTAISFSAIGYYVAKILRKKLGVAIGIISCYWGGKNIQTFIKLSDYQKYDSIKHYADNYLDSIKGIDMEKYNREYIEFSDIIEKYTEYGGNDPVDFYRRHGGTAPIAAMTGAIWPARMMDGPYNSSRPGCLWETMVSRLIPYSVKAVLWYQGETNANDYPENYCELFHALLECWRDGFMDSDLPFYTVEIAPYGGADPENGWARIREQQQKCVKRESRTYIVPTGDCGDKYNIHPVDKIRVAERLAMSLMRYEYGMDVVGCAPMYSSYKTDGNKMIISFTGVEKFQPLTYGLFGFTVCGEDRVFYDAYAQLDGNKIILFSDKVEHPVAARYAFSKWYEPTSAYNEGRWPLHPFRTDDF